VIANWLATFEPYWLALPEMLIEVEAIAALPA